APEPAEPKAAAEPVAPVVPVAPSGPSAPDGPTATDAPAQDQEPPDATAVILFRGVTWLVERVQENAGLLGRQAIQTGAGAVQAALGVLTSVGFFFFGAFITGFFFFFISVRYARVVEFLDSLVPVQNRPLVRELAGQMDRVIAGFIRGRVTICAIFIVYFTIAYWLIGVPAPLALGPIVGLLCLVPYAATAGMIIAIALMWLEPSTALFGLFGGGGGAWWWIIGAPALIHGAGQILDDYILTPRIQGQSTGMDTPTILFASLAGAVLAGFYGVLLAIPVAACVKIALQRLFWPRFKAWAAGRASDPLPLKE
ncbi:MAG: AI-2E family transporter, partial [Planctomyces sp.]